MTSQLIHTINEIKSQGEVYVPQVAEINHVIEMPSMPLRNESEDIDHEMKSQLKNINHQIQQMKSESDLSDKVSSHDVHHYAAIYGLMGVLAVAGALLGWRRARQRRREQQPNQATDTNSAPQRNNKPLETVRIDKIDKGTSPLFHRSIFEIKENFV